MTTPNQDVKLLEEKALMIRTEVVRLTDIAGAGHYGPAFSIAEMLAIEVTQDIGFQEPWDIEVLPAELRLLPMEEMIGRAYDTTIAQFQQDSVAR